MGPREVRVRFETLSQEQDRHAYRVVESARGYLKREMVVGGIRDGVLNAPASARPVDIATYVLREVDQALHALQVAYASTEVPRYLAGPDDASSRFQVAWAVTDRLDGMISALFVERCPAAEGFVIGTQEYADAINRVRTAALAACERLNAGGQDIGQLEVW